MSKYDIPYSMKPTKKGRKKQSKYSSYIEENDTFVNRLFSTPARKLIAYVTFFSIFAVIFFTALRNSKHPEALDYELELGFPDSKEQNLIDQTIVDVNDNTRIGDADSVDVEVDEIDILDSDDGELQLADDAEAEDDVAKTKPKANAQGKGKGKAPVKAPSKKATNGKANGQGKAQSKQGGVKDSVEDEANEEWVVKGRAATQNNGMLGDEHFSEELKGMMSSGNSKLEKEKGKLKKGKQSRQKQITDEELVEKMDKLEAEKAKGRKKNAFKGENL
ncbi:hypothetical protein PMKS-002213 [Pichia membranifaciens]|uniref:Uncharacterized protein n=1 Tax=Pichia membranifaciens TaxID=4926 RepID=A0A1Q2YGT9_9ASCO|nr:hypothetical protein PMKS-002213 [Pichia membranifaciens]